MRENKAGPALVEQVAGNVFKTRIYPVPKNSFRTLRLYLKSDLMVRLTCFSEVTKSGFGSWYLFPLIMDTTLESFQFKCVTFGTCLPQLKSLGGIPSLGTFIKDENKFNFEVEQNNMKWEGKPRFEK